jgi:3-dehydroquinate synthase
MKQTKLIVGTKSERYPILIGKNLISKLSKILKENSINCKKCLIVIDKNVPKKIISTGIKSLRKINIFKHYIIASEKNKNQKNVDEIVNILLEKNFSREDCLISIGGGITGDVTGFAASIFKRGLKFINIPSTLLSQVDSSIGGKTGINTKHGKNLIGSFYQPKLVISDTNFLKTLSRREIVCGYGEILKHSLISNRKLYFFLEKNIDAILNLKSPYIEKIIYESCKIKKIVVEKDEKEMGIRKILNLGHTFAHAYEASLNFSKKLNHGEAVILGIRSAIKFGLSKKIISKKEFDLIFRHLDNKKFPTSIKDYFSLEDCNKIISFMIKDKKNNSEKIKLILIKRIGLPIVDKEYSKKNIVLFLKKELTN